MGLNECCVECAECGSFNLSWALCEDCVDEIVARSVRKGVAEGARFQLRREEDDNAQANAAGLT